MPAIQILNLGKTYTPALRSSNSEEGSGTVAVKDLSLDIQEGEIFGLLGPNGAGKSTTINIICGGTKKSSGKIFIQFKDIDTHHTEVKHIIGLVPQEIVFDRFLTVQETLQYQSGYYGLKDNKKYIDELLDALNLVTKRNTSTAYLSGGMKRRLLVARALVHQPKIVILDEPTAGVDVELRQNLWEYVNYLNQQKKTTIILTTHYLEEAEQMSHRIGVINNGQLMALGTVKELKNKFGEHQKRITFGTDKPIDKCPGFDIENKDGHYTTLLKESDIPHFFSLLKERDIHTSDLEIQSESLESVFTKILKK
jgi:ABC-2 type transport system ATP-binding protein